MITSYDFEKENKNMLNWAKREVEIACKKKTRTGVPVMKVR